MIKEAVSVNGNPYRNYLCSNSVAGCHFFWQVYYDDVADIPVKYHRQMDRYFRPQVAAPLPPPTNNLVNPRRASYGRTTGVSAPPAPPPQFIPPPPTQSSADDLPF